LPTSFPRGITEDRFGRVAKLRADAACTVEAHALVASPARNLLFLDRLASSTPPPTYVPRMAKKGVVDIEAKKSMQ